MLTTEQIASYADWENGLISPHVFSSEEVYRLELERLFSKCWLFLAHESQIPNPGDFFSTYMGADPILVVRQADGSIGAFLNACRHRGMKVCRADEGNAKGFTCTYHGWSYDMSGRLAGVPLREDAYLNEIDLTQWGLIPVPFVDEYKGLVFGCFDPGAVTLDEYLGDMKYYLDILFDRTGGVEFVGGVQKAKMSGNWKLAAEQFAGDTYHAPFTHISDFSTVMPAELIEQMRQQPRTSGGLYKNSRQFASRLGHATGYDIAHDTNQVAATGGDHIVDLHRDVIETEIRERLSDDQADIYRGHYQHANLFPNLSWLNSPHTIRVWHPKGPNEMEIYSWVFVDKNATPEVKRQEAWFAMHQFGPQGLAEQDDGENFSLIAANFANGGHQVHNLKLNYQMGLKQGETHDDSTIFREGIGESGQRMFYRRWLEFMSEPS